LEERPGSNL